MILLFILCLGIPVTLQHEARPPGIPPPNFQAQGQGHVHQQQQNLQYQQGQHGQQGQQFQGQQFQGQGQYQGQGQANTQQFQQQQHQQQHQYQQQQQQHGGPPSHGGQQHGGGGHPPGGHQGFGQNELVHDADHIKEHLKEVVDKPKDQMTEEELEFHYFKLHDYDSNNRLDGTEIVKAITHFHDEGNENTGESQHQKKVFTDEELVNIVDLVLKEDDLNLDGYIEYAEFVTAQRRARQTGDTEDAGKS